MGQAARSASAIAQARAASGRSDMSDAFLAAWRPVRFSGLFSQRYLVPLGSRPLSADDFASARLTRSASRGASRMTWRRSTAWEALGVAPAHPSEHGAAMSRATSGVAGASPPCASSWAQGRPYAPVGLVRARGHRRGRGARHDRRDRPRLEVCSVNMN